MSAQDKTEQVLRALHVLLSQSKMYDKEQGLVIVDKRKMIQLFSELNQCIYEIMDEHELTKKGRDAAERHARKQGEEIIADASKKAEDVYAASVLYTDEALRLVQDIMQSAADSMKEVYSQMEENIQKERQRVQKDQLDLKGYLQDLKDTDEYLKLIKEHNKKKTKEKLSEADTEMAAPAAPKPEIRINEAYFKEHGIALEEEEQQPEEKTEYVAPEITVNLDSEYFKWKEQEAAGETDNSAGKKNEKRSLFGKMKKSE